MTAEEAIRALLGTYERALNTADAALAVSCFTDDGVVMPQALPTAAGTQLSETYERFFAPKRYDVAFVFDEIVVANEDLAYAITHSGGTITSLEDGTARAGANREMFVFRRAGNEWRIARYIFNNDVRPPAS